MLTYDPPVDDIVFLMKAFGYDRVADLDAFDTYDIDTVRMLLEEGGRFFSEEVLPTNREGDKKGVEWDPETKAVTTPESFKEVWNQIAENGYLGLNTPAEYGGSGAPYTLGTMFSEFGTAANKSLSMCGGLSSGLTIALLENATEEQKQKVVPKLASGEWGATMALTEPHCGTDLGLIRSRAEPIDGEDNAYELSGNKIWITFGDQDLTDNIVHFVLAKLPDAPEGTDGISAFLVPKYLPDSGTRNDVYCAGIDHKMGIHASPTCEMKFDGAKGWMVGEPHEGMKSMFVMMNEARLKVGVEGPALSEIAYQTALKWAKDRDQGKALDPDKRDPDSKADNILVHPDVRRMLADVKASTEGMRGLIAWASVEMDLAHEHPDDDKRQEAEDLVALLTPVIKSYCTEKGFDNVSEALQVTGGSGYTKDLPIEQYLRDMRIAMIYEGTNHIQALDLVGRKLKKDDGRLYRTFQSRITELIQECDDVDEMEAFVDPLKEASSQLNDVTMQLGAKAMEDREEAGAAASNYLKLFALTAISYVWARQIKYAIEHDSDELETKRKTARFFFEQILPERHALAKKIEAGKETMMAFERSEF
jgi:alkylation response protein AidB-like acyl-CoA dehydrogenase